MIRPNHPRQPAAATVDHIPRALAYSELGPSGDHIEILLPRFRDRLVLKYFAPYMPRDKRWIRYPLDSRGSRIWCLLDGQRTVAEVIDAYADRYPGDSYQAPQRVWAYLRYLESHGFVEVVAAGNEA